MICPKFKGICQETEDVSRRVSCGGDCRLCSVNGGASITIGELEKLYIVYQDERRKCRPVTVKTNLQALHTFCRWMKLPSGAKVSCITKEMQVEFYDLTASDLMAATRKTIIEALSKITCEDFCEWCRQKGRIVEHVRTPKGLSGAYRRYEPISETSRRALGDLRFRYRNMADPRKWMALTLGLKQVWAKADVVRGVWSDFRVVDGVVMLEHERNKTGKMMTWIVDEEDWREWQRVRAIMRGTRKFCAHQYLGVDTTESLFRIPIAKKDHLVSSTIVNEINADLRETVQEWKTDPKAFHCLRKEFANYVCRQYDWETAEQATGDTTKILQKSYVGKKRIDWKSMKGMSV